MIEFLYFNNKPINATYQGLPWIYDELHPYAQTRLWNEQGGHVVSRVHDMACPVPLAGTISPMPQDIQGQDLDFGRCFDAAADFYIKDIVNRGLRPYLFYSGGIDSVSVLVAMLRNGNRDFLGNLTILCNQDSFYENPYFYDRYIQGKFPIIDTDAYQVDFDTADQIAILDGEAGNQCMGSCKIYDLVRKGEFDLLSSHWAVIMQDPGLNSAERFLIDATAESLSHAPIEIETVHDFLWWNTFNFKFDEVLLRKLLTYTHGMSPKQRQRFYHNNLIRFYAHPDMQRWSMASLPMRRESLNNTTKYFSKRYIWEFDHNDIWYQQKREMPSSSQIFIERDLGQSSIFAMDSDFNLFDLKDRSTRQMIKKWLVVGT